jgi:hypothetical protein
MAMMPERFARTPEKWDEAADAIINEIRTETGIADWVPTFLNGRHEFERRIIAKLTEKAKS